MKLILWAVATCVFASACAERGGSLRGALEALQRRQRGRHVAPDYETLYEFVPPQVYPEPDYDIDVEDIEEESPPKYVIKLLNENERLPEAYEYKIIKKDSGPNTLNSGNKKQSAFRERTQHPDNDRLRDLFVDKNNLEEKENLAQEKEENDAEYALLLGQLWSKYKNNKGRLTNPDSAPQGVVKLYKDKMVKKSYPSSWGPIAFKRKRSPDLESERQNLEYDGSKSSGDDQGEINPNYNTYESSDKPDMREEYAIAFQPLEDENFSDVGDEDQYTYDTIEKRFPVSKRSSGPYYLGSQKKRYALDQNKSIKTKSFRSGAGTDPKLINDLSKIFGNSEIAIIKNPVKRSSDHEEDSHDTKPPNLTVIPNNNTQKMSNETHHDEHSHEHQEHSIHPPGIAGKEVHNHNDHDNIKDGHSHDDHEHKHPDHHFHEKEQRESEKPIILKKKSIDWSDYFGIDKRLKKPVSFINNLNEGRFKKQYLDTFNKEVVYPLNSFRKNSYVKRNYVQSNSIEENEASANNEHPLTLHNEKRNSESDNESKLDNIDKKLKNMEGLIVDEALHYTNIGEELDSKEEQEMKEKLLSRLAAAYSLEKMRKALKEFKQSLQVQKVLPTLHSSLESTDNKNKRVAVKKEKVIISNDIPVYTEDEKNRDFEDEQGAGHYLNGKLEEELSDGYMGGSGRHRVPVISTASSSGACPVLAKIVQRCRGVDLLAGDRGQLFLPLCSLHQICYLCGEAPPTTCDLVFLSEADSTCEGDMSCQRAARSALMALRELHDNLADELDGECEASPCLPATLKLNTGWQRALQR